MAEGRSSDVLIKSNISNTQRIISAITPFTRTPPALIWENQEIFKMKSVSYTVNNESEEISQGRMDFSTDIDLMQTCTEVFGGNSVERYEEEYAKFCLAQKDKETELSTSIEILNEPCLSMAQRYSQGGEALVMDLAERNAEHVCGSWDSYYKGSQEEAIERQSVFLRYALDPKLNPTLRNKLSLLSPGSPVHHHIPAYGAVLVRHVPIIRNEEMQFNRDWWKCGVVAVGAPDLRVKPFRETDFHHFSNSSALAITKHFFSYRGVAPDLNLEELRESLKRKIRISLIAAVSAGYKELVLGALGCGAYRNPIDEVARCFALVMKESQFRTVFERVGFAVLGEPTFSLFRQHFLAEWEKIE